MRLSELPDGWRVSVDTETSGKRIDSGARVSIVSWAFRHPETGSLSSGAVPFDQGVVTPLGEKDIPSRHRKRLAKWSPEHQEEVAPNLPPERYEELIAQLCRFEIVYHHRKFDEVMLATGLRGMHSPLNPPCDHRRLAEAFAWDTMVAQNAIAPQFSPGLKPTGRRLELMGGGEDDEQAELQAFLGPKDPKLDYPDGPRFDLVPWSIIGRYAAKDAELTLLLDEWQTAFLTDGPNLWLQKIVAEDLDVTSTLINMERRGVGWNVERAKQMARLLSDRQKELATILPFKGGTGAPTPQSAKKFFFDDAGRRPYKGKVTSTGAPQLDTEVQEALIKDGVEFAAEYHEHEKCKSARSKWYVGWTDKCGSDGRLRCDFDQVSVITGRLAGKWINLVAIPHDHLLPDLPGLVSPRGLIEPKPGHSLWEVDVAQAEVRIGTALAECEGFYEGFVNGIDAHSRMSDMIFGTHDQPYRQYAKTNNLALQYGTGIDRLKAQLEADTGERWTRKRTKEIRNAWHAAAPEMGMALDVAQHQAETLGYVRLWNGRIRWFEHFRGGSFDPPWTAFNAKCQGGMAEIMKIVMNKWDQRFPGTLLVQTHDSLLLELPDDGYLATYPDGSIGRLSPQEMCEEASELLVREFEKAMTRPWKSRGGQSVTVPFEADIKEFGK